MSNVHKASNVTQLDKPRVVSQPQQRYITIQIPVLDIPGDTMEKKRRKMLEEIDEYLAEVSTGPINNKDALGELLDILQTFAGYLLCETKESIIVGEQAHEYVESFIQHGNDRHIAKMKQYAGDRGWELVRHG